MINKRKEKKGEEEAKKRKEKQVSIQSERRDECKTQISSHLDGNITRPLCGASQTRSISLFPSDWWLAFVWLEMESAYESGRERVDLFPIGSGNVWMPVQSLVWILLRLCAEMKISVDIISFQSNLTRWQQRRRRRRRRQRRRSWWKLAGSYLFLTSVRLIDLYSGSWLDCCYCCNNF